MRYTSQQRREFRKALGQRMALLRYRIRRTRPEAAKACGVSLSTVYEWENGIHEPTAYHLRRLAAFLCVTADELLGAKVARVQT